MVSRKNPAFPEWDVRLVRLGLVVQTFESILVRPCTLKSDSTSGTVSCT